MLSTRLAKSAASIKDLTGIAALCDIVILKDIILNPNQKPNPKTIFVSMYQEISFRIFIENILPMLHLPNKYVIILASEDATFPFGKGDRRPRMQREYTRQNAHLLINHPAIKRIFVENLDSNKYEKLYPLPLGVLPDCQTKIIRNVDFNSRKMKCFFCHRIRNGRGQWAERQKVYNRCINEWAEITTTYIDEIDHTEFVAELSSHIFTICVHGGGIDPSPRAWEAIMRGSIPIIRDSPLSKAYSQLPVVIIPTFNDPNAISIEKLEKWLSEFRHYYENPEARRKVCRRLSLKYWVNKID